MTVLEIFIFRGEQFLGSRVFTDATVTIGRGNATMLRLDDKAISRVHATIRVDGARLVIRDEGSQIGTRLNGEPVREKTFREVDTIEIGGFRLKVARRSMAGATDYESDEPTEVGLRADAVRRALETAAEATPLPMPAPFGGPETSGLRPAQAPQGRGQPAISLDRHAGAPPEAPAAPVQPRSQMRPGEGAGPDLPAPQGSLVPPAPAASSSLPTQKLEVISAAAPAPQESAAPALVRVTPPPRDSSIEELTAGLEDSSVWALRQSAAPAARPAPAAAPAPEPGSAPSLSELAQALVEFSEEPSTVRRPPEAADRAGQADLVPPPAAPAPYAARSGPHAVQAVAARAASGPQGASGPTPAAPTAHPAQPAPAPAASGAHPARSAPHAAAPSPARGAQDPDATPLFPVSALPEEHGGEDDDEDERFVPSFSLLELLDRDPLPPKAQDSALRLEIIHHRDGQVLDVQQLPRRRNFPPTGRRLVRLDADGRAQLAITEDVGGRVFLNGRPIPLEEIRRGARDRKGVALLEMREGDRAEVVVSQAAPAGGAPLEHHYHIRFVRLPELAAERARPLRALVGALGNRYLVGAVAAHALVLFLLSLLPSGNAQATPEEPRFAEVSIKAIQLEPPPEVKPPEPEPPPPPLQPTVEPRPTRTRVRTPRTRAPQKAQPSALAALEMIKPADTASQSLKDVVSNINAVSVPADARSRFKVGGAIGKLPISEVRVSTAGVARDATTSGRELLSKEDVGKLKGAGGSGNVRGVVKQAPPAALQSAGSGRLSRAQIQKVINEHVAAVQACYEKNLMRDHSLAGKITFDWVISPSGSVASVRVRASTMAGSSVSTCILQEIRTWTFPQPEGGSVSVTYPFIFTAQGY